MPEYNLYTFCINLSKSSIRKINLSLSDRVNLANIIDRVNLVS